MKKILLYIFMSGLIPCDTKSMDCLITPPEDETPDLVESRLFCINSALIIAQIIIIVVLKKRNYFFGKKILPSTLNIDGAVYRLKPMGAIAIISATSTLTCLYSLFMCSSFPPALNKEEQIVCSESEYRRVVAIVLASICSIIHTTNLSHNNSLKKLREKFMGSPIELKSKIAFCSEFLENLKCAICFDIPNIDAVNPCDHEEHVFCRACLTDWFNNMHKLQKEHSPDDYYNYAHERKYSCISCTREINDDNTKIEISRPTAKLYPTAKDILQQLAGCHGILIIIYGAIIYIALIKTLQV